MHRFSVVLCRQIKSSRPHLNKSSEMQCSDAAYENDGLDLQLWPIAFDVNIGVFADLTSASSLFCFLQSLLNFAFNDCEYSLCKTHLAECSILVALCMLIAEANCTFCSFIFGLNNRVALQIKSVFSKVT